MQLPDECSREACAPDVLDYLRGDDERAGAGLRPARTAEAGRFKTFPRDCIQGESDALTGGGFVLPSYRHRGHRENDGVPGG